MLACFYDLGASAIAIAAPIDPVPPGRDYLYLDLSRHVASPPPAPAGHVRFAYRQQGVAASIGVAFKTTA